MKNIIPSYSNPKYTLIITSKGKKIEAKPCHQRVLENLYMEQKGISTQRELREHLKKCEYTDLFDYLLTETKSVATWEGFYKGTPNKTQQNAINSFINEGIDMKAL